ncbi:MAG: 1,4-alpha-glucan branching protein GlgB [Chitinivibrionales bacterium]|nr:1,4-alpha-glucan branching protein GlgB [Chitinivibrionales bacterium]
MSIRVFYPDAESVSIRPIDGSASLVPLIKKDEKGFFSTLLTGIEKPFKYEVTVQKRDATTLTYIDPYCFLPAMSEHNRYLFNEGNHQKVYEDLGSHLRTVEGVEGTVFAVWAPNAKRVSVVGGFNNWDGRIHQMRILGSSGIWELFIPGIGEGVVYKYEIKKHDQDHLILKTDPYGYSQEPFPYHGSVIRNLESFAWTDDEWIKQRATIDLLQRPMSIYEVHLGSWRKCGPNEEGDYLSFRDLAHQLAVYIKEMGFTHIELMPVQDHPFVPSWGYQVGGFYAVNHRFGTPQDFQYFVNYLHANGIGVILDWVAGHFPKDSYGLVHFDGSHLYEHQNPLEGEHKDWGTLIFNYGRHEVRNFLTANALFWIEKFHVDGLRIDAVASMLYRNYSRKDGEWIPNKYGGVENLEAIQFLQSVNYLVHTRYPGVLTLAEESTAWPMVSRPTNHGGLGFTYKWNMGWMHDTLFYFTREPIHRKYHQDQVTFGMWYAFSENFVLVLSHDEVVHGKHSILEKMPGDMWQKFANVRALYTFMIGHPGKKLLFMGNEFGMHNEWFEKRSIDWHVLTDCPCSNLHQGLSRLVVDLNSLYRKQSCLWECDYTPEGFAWIDYEDRDNSIVSFIRQGKEWNNFCIFICNFTPVVRENYKVGVPYKGTYSERLNSDSPLYGGSGVCNPGPIASLVETWQGRPYCLNLRLPPLGVVVLHWDSPQ